MHSNLPKSPEFLFVYWSLCFRLIMPNPMNERRETLLVKVCKHHESKSPISVNWKLWKIISHCHLRWLIVRYQLFGGNIQKHRSENEPKQKKISIRIMCLKLNGRLATCEYLKNELKKILLFRKKEACEFASSTV